MVKKLSAVILAALILFSAAGCNNYTAVTVGKLPDSKYAVTSNGGLAVQYGNLIYFINGFKSPADTDGKNNVWGGVVKGGIIRPS